LSSNNEQTTTVVELRSVPLEIVSEQQLYLQHKQTAARAL